MTKTRNQFTTEFKQECVHLVVSQGYDVVREKRGITTDTAIRLARFFGTSAEFWLGLQNSCDLKMADEQGVGQKIAREVSPLMAA